MYVKVIASYKFGSENSFHVYVIQLFIVALCNRADHYIFAL